MKFVLVAFDVELYYAWQEYFDHIDDVDVIDGDILKQKGDAIVSPANSFGYMDGGLDLKLSEHFGWDLEKRLRDKLEQEYFGELPVGQAVVVETNNRQVPYLISAPTMRVPDDVSETVNAYLAFKAVIQAAVRFNQENANVISTILCPGLGTGEGRMSATTCARQMHAAYETCVEGKILRTGGLATAVRNHLYLLGQ